jgi:hypothetical protein
LSFLPQVAEDLAALLVDPRLGDCESALESGPLLVDPSWAEMIKAIKDAFRTADDNESTLVLALIGHGIAVDEDFYFVPRNGTGIGRSDEDVFLSQLLKEELRKAAYLDGLLVLLDTCHAGVGAAAAAAWREVGLGRHRRRYEMLTASADRAAYGGKVTKALIDTLRQGIPSAGTTIDTRYLGDPLMKAAAGQHPQRITHDGGGWKRPGDEGLWWAHNAAHDVTAGKAGSLTAVRERIVELTAYLQPIPVLDELSTASIAAGRVALVGPRGSGKSTLAAALARPEATHDQVPDHFVQAIAFATRTSTLADIAGILAAQLANEVPGFAEASYRYKRRLGSDELQGLDALRQHVIGPLTIVEPPPTVRLVIDALDELPAATRSSTLRALSAINDEIHLVVTTRPDSAHPAGSRLISTDRASDTAITAYLRARGIVKEHWPALVHQVDGNWLHARLLADRALRPGFNPAALPDDIRLSLTALYDDELLAAGADDLAVWQSTLRPVLGVLAVAGAGPILPLPLLVAASRHLGGPGTTSRVRDALARLSGIVVRTQPGQPGEHVGLFHASLADSYLLRSGDGQFGIVPAEYDAALTQAIDDLAPLENHDLTNSLHRYALRAEAHHRWHASHDSNAVIASLLKRSAGSAADERERWQPWPNLLSATLGPEHRDTLIAQARLAGWIGRAGDPASARDRLTELLPVYEKVFGPEHPSTLTVRAGLADWVGQAGDSVAARDQCAALLPVREKISGPEHPDTLIARASLAGWTGEAGDPATARDQLTKLLRLCEQVADPEHPELLTVRASLAWWTGRAGGPATARDQYAALLPLREKISGPEHRRTLGDRASMAWWTGQAGDPSTARDQLTDLLPVYERVAGPEHPETLTVRGHRAWWTGRSGNPAAARDQYAALLPVREKISGRDHPETLMVRGDLAVWKGMAGDPVAARDQLAAMLPDFERVFGSDHPNTLNLRAALNIWTWAAMGHV